MKEVCERTGLTDRAVRLYIESGLLSPTQENSYTGRRSIHFSEEDVSVLETIAILRKADFSIFDIRDMQSSPKRINEILNAHKQKLAMDIENKQNVLQSLEKITCNGSMDYTEVAELIRRSASRNFIPKEDSGMHFKDLQLIIKNRIFSVIAFALLLVGVVTLTPLFIQTAFADTEIMGGGLMTVLYTFTWERFFRHIQLIGAAVLMIAALILMFVYIIRGQRRLLIVGGILCVLSIAAMLFLPAEIRDTLYRYEFLSYRQSFMWHVLHAYSSGFDFFIQSLKFISPLTASVLACIGILRHEDTPSEPVQ